MRDGRAVASARGVTAVHDKDGWLGAIGLWQQLEQQGGLRSASGSRRRPTGSTISARSAFTAAPARRSCGSAT